MSENARPSGHLDDSLSVVGLVRPSQLETDPSVDRVDGCVESLTPWGVTGWVWFPEQPSRAAEVIAVAGGETIGRTTANDTRQDIASSGRGSGRCGFSIKFPSGAIGSNTPEILVVCTDCVVPLHGVPFSIVEGYLDSLTRWGAVGWAWLPGAPDYNAPIEAFLDGEFIGRTVAHEMRPDIAKSGRGTGRYGFSMRFEKMLEGTVVPVLRVVTSDHYVTLQSANWSNVEGYVGSITQWGAIGWAWMPELPDQVLQVEATLDGIQIGQATADQIRPDLQQSGRGTGRYGFTMSFGGPLPGDRLPLIVASGPLGSELLPGTTEFAPLRPDPPEQVPLSTTRSLHHDALEVSGLNVEGHVDSLTRWGAMGWAWFPSSPGNVAQIEALLDGRVVGRAAADHARPDLAAGGKGTGRYGFVIAFDGPLVGNIAPSIRVLGPEGPTVLSGADELPEIEQIGASSDHPLALTEEGSKVALALPPLSVEGSLDILTRGGARGWVWLPAHPHLSVQVEAVLNGKVIGRAVGDQFRADLLQYNKGSGYYGFEMHFDERVTGTDSPVFQTLAPIGQTLAGVSTLPVLTREDTERRERGSIDRLLLDHAQFTARGPEFAEFDPTILKQLQKPLGVPLPLLMAFYLPQFHAIPENDAFWGKGFTEWRQLARGTPRFPGHYQPRTPRDLGFYDLGDVESLRDQAELAQAAGVGAFAFYYYWFNQKRVLEKPLDILLKSDVEMPFLIIWANENWTRTWDGSESQLLLKQDYNFQDENALLKDLARHFTDPRYVKLRGRPLFVIYNPSNIPDAVETLKRWRDTFRRDLDVDPVIFMAQTFGTRDPAFFGLDGAVEFPPHKLADKLSGREMTDAYSKDFSGQVVAYDDFVDTSLSEADSDFPLVKTVVPSWDNDARRPNRAFTLEASTPAKYERWLQALIVRALARPILDTPIVAINAWNEWAEGAYLEPDVHFGAGYLNATARACVSAMDEFSSGQRLSSHFNKVPPAVSVVLPNYNHSKYIAERIRSVVGQSLRPAEIIFLDDCSSDDSVSIARGILQESGIPFRVLENEANSGNVFKQWMKGMACATNELIWIAETDDSADPEFLSRVTVPLLRGDVMASFGRITCIDGGGHPRGDLDRYFVGLKDFSWNFSTIVPAYQAFSHDFAIQNVIPNASGLVFKKPTLTPQEIRRLLEYKFAGDWYFYALVTRGGAIAYNRLARSFFRVNDSSASRDLLLTAQHSREHGMIVQDISDLYGISSLTLDKHVAKLAEHFPGDAHTNLRQNLQPAVAAGSRSRAQRICIAAHSFSVGGGEVLPLELANALKGMGYQVTYLVVETPALDDAGSIRHRLRSDIPVVLWEDVATHMDRFLVDYGIDLINSHNVSFDHRYFLLNTKLAVPYFASLHGGYETAKEYLTSGFAEFLSSRVSKWLFLSEKNVGVLRDHGVLLKSCVHSFNAVQKFEGVWIERQSFRKAHNISEEAFVLVLCSRAIESKGWDCAVRVVTMLQETSSRDVHLVLIGDGPDAPLLRSRAADLACVTFLGNVDNPIRYFSCFDMGIFPSKFTGETFPLFLLECFQSGIPAISTDIGEVPRIYGPVVTDRPGELVPHSIAPDLLASEMARYISRVLRDKQVYQKLCKNAKRVSAQFGMRELAELYDREIKGYYAVRGATDVSYVETYDEIEGAMVESITMAT